MEYPIALDYLNQVKLGNRSKANWILAHMTSRAAQVALQIEAEWEQKQAELEDAANTHRLLTQQELSTLTGVKRPTEGKRGKFKQYKVVTTNGQVIGWKVQYNS